MLEVQNLKCEHVLCEFTNGHPAPAEYTVELGLYTNLLLCKSCYLGLIGSIITTEVEHFAERLAVHSRFMTKKGS